MFRLSFGRENLENIKEQPFVFVLTCVDSGLHAQIWYATEMISYTDLEVDFMDHPQGTAKECLRMARVFLLYLLGAYLFANGGKMVSLRLLALFLDFERARAAN